MSQNFQQAIIDELRGLFEPLVRAAREDEARRALFARIGWQIDADAGFPDNSVFNALTDVANAYDTLKALIDGGAPTTIAQLTATFDAAAQVSAAVKALSNLGGAPAEFAALASDLLNALLIDRLRLRPVLYALAKLLTVVQARGIPAVLVDHPSVPGRKVMPRLPAQVEEISFSHLKTLLQDPVGTLKTEYGLTSGLTDPNATADLLFPRLAALLSAFKVQAIYGLNGDTPIDLGAAGDDIARHSLTLLLALLGDSSANEGFGLNAFLDGDLGLVVAPFGTATVDETFGAWAVEGSIGVVGPGFAVSSTGVTFGDGAGDGQVDLHISAHRIPDSEDELASPDGTTSSIGGTQGTRLELGDFTIAADVSLSQTSREFGFSVKTGKSALIISGGDGDGLLSTILPKEFRTDFDLGAGWSNVHGLSFSGSAALEVVIPVNVSLAGVLEVKSIRLRVKIGDPGIDVTGTATAAAQLGPVSLVVQDVGIGALFSFPDGGGNLGPADAALSFRLPDGVGVAVDS
ncbi:MAG TPA: hypothetical protein VIF57_06420, partial [Polyangia bacterium]